MCHNFSTYNLVLEQVKPMFFKNARHSDFNFRLKNTISLQKNENL